MKQEERLKALAQAVGQDIKDLRDRPAVVFNSDDFTATFVKLNPAYDPENPASEQFIPAEDTDPDKILFISRKDPPGEVLPAPEFGAVTKDSTSFSIPVINKPAGAQIAWTDNGDNQAGNDTPLERQGQAPESVHNIVAKFTKDGIADSPTSEITVTLDASSGYVVDRRWYINLRHQFGDDAGAPWGNVRFDQAGVTNVAASTGTGNIGVSQQVAFSGGTASVGAPTNALYASEIINSGWEFQTSNSTIRISGLTNGKYYHIYAGTWGDSNANQKSSISVGGETLVKANYRTVGVLGENEFASTFYTRFKNKQPTAGVLDIVFNAVDFYNNYTEALIIEESSTQKP